MKKKVILGITGSVAAYKTAELAAKLVKKNIDVQAILTKSAEKFVTPLALQLITKSQVYVGDSFKEDDPETVLHIELARQADCLLIAPATANMIGKLAAGLADDMLSVLALAIHEKPIILCPAMNTHMYTHPIVQENIARLKNIGFIVIEPREAVLACGDEGVGALAELDSIVDAVLGVLG